MDIVEEGTPAASDRLDPPAAMSPPGDAETLLMRGALLANTGRFEEALVPLRRAAELAPARPEIHYTLGKVLRQLGHPREAADAHRRAIALRPNFVPAHNGLGNALLAAGRPAEAVAAFDAAVAIKLDYAEAHNNRGVALRAAGRADEAEGSFRKALALDANYAEAHNNLGVALKAAGRRKDAIGSFKEAIRLKPGYLDALDNLAGILRALGQLDEAAAILQQIIALKPSSAKAFVSLGNALKDLGRLDESIASFRQAVQRMANPQRVHSNLVYSLYFHRDYDEQDILGAHLDWARRYTQPLRVDAQQKTRTVKRNNGGKLRIGYVSGDLREHVVGRNMLPLLREHDRSAFEIFCYSTTSRPEDDFTREFRKHASEWRSLANVSDDNAAELIRADEIDVLVDLSLHMAGNRMGVFARKPSPVQITFAGYPGGTGVSEIDYRLSDPYLDPPDTDPAGDNRVQPTMPAAYVEKTIRLPHSFWCYDPAAMGVSPDAPASPLPALRNNYVTFGCLNNFCKINNEVLSLWGRVLSAVPNSRVVMLAPHGSARKHVCDQLARFGIKPGRVGFVGRHKRNVYLRIYDKIDIGLDTVPYNGHTTSLDSFWMGVPVVTLVGRTVVGRAGFSQLMNLGLPGLVAKTPEEFARVVADLAGELPRLQELRANLRRQMLSSPICDATGFTRGVEAAYRQAREK